MDCIWEIVSSSRAIVLARELAHIAVQVLWTDLVKRALVRTLEGRTRSFYAVGVRHLLDVLARAVTDALVPEWHAFLGIYIRCYPLKL